MPYLEDLLHEQARIDVPVNNSGVTFPHELLEYPDDAWQKNFQINLEAPLRLARRLTPRMIALAQSQDRCQRHHRTEVFKKIRPLLDR